MATLAFNRLTCTRTGHVGDTDDHVQLQFFVDGSQTPILWPASGDAEEMGAGYGELVNVSIEFQTEVEVKLVNFHMDNKNDPEPWGSHTFLADLGEDNPSDTVKLTDADNKDVYYLEFAYLDYNPASVTLLGIECIKPASAINQEVLEAASNAVELALIAFGETVALAPDPRVAAAGAALKAAGSVISAVPEVAAAIGNSTSFSDHLYIALGGSNSAGSKIFPTTMDYETMNSGDELDLQFYSLTFPVLFTTQFTLWEADQTRDDNLGYIKIDHLDEPGYYITLVESQSEGSIYLVSYQIVYGEDTPVTK